MPPKEIKVQTRLEWPQNVNEAVIAGDYDKALDCIICAGMTPPADLLAAASAKATAKAFPRYIVHYEAYRGRVRVWAIKPGHEQIVTDTDYNE